MKTCPHCGENNDVGATRCGACGKEFGAAPAAPRQWNRVAVLESEAESERLEVELKHLGIRHVIVSHSDSALDGLYQMSKGWGHVEADAENASTILSLLDDFRQGKLADSPSEETGPDSNLSP